MRILHTSDWHLGVSFGTADAHRDQEYVLDRIAGIVKEKEADAVIIAGDVFDRSVASAEAIALYDGAVTRLCAGLGVPVLIIAGNHDGAERLASCAELLKNSGLYVCGKLEREPCRVTLGDTEFFLLPWFTADKVRSLWPEEAEQVGNLQDAFELVCGKLRASFTPGKRHVAVAHAFLVNAVTSGSDRIAEVGLASAVNAEVFRGFDYVALGHLHGPQDIGSNARYSGSPLCTSFGREETQVKSVTLLDTQTMERETVPIVPLRDRFTFRGTLEEVLSADYTLRQRDAYVRAEVTDAYLGLENVARLREVFPHLLEASGKQFGGENGSITMTIEELEEKAGDPEAVFRDYYRDNRLGEPDDHVMELFRRALADYRKEAEEG